MAPDESRGHGDDSAARLAAAELYESEVVPNVLQAVAERLIDRAGVGQGHIVLDVGCGTGVVARECAHRVGPTGEVAGLDISKEMLTVARRVAPDIEWIQGKAGLLPFGTGSFDCVLSQFAMMFFPDQSHAISEMWRVLGVGGRLGVVVSGGLEDSPVNSTLARIIHRRVGKEGLGAVEAIWTVGGESGMAQAFAAAGVDPVDVRTEHGTTEYPSIASFVEAEVRGWSPLSELVDDTTLAGLIDDARRELAFAVDTDGRLRFNPPYYAITATKTGVER